MKLATATTALLATLCAAQGKAPKPGADIFLSVVCSEEGEKRPRYPDAKAGSEEAKQFRFVGRQVTWILDGKKCETEASLKKLLRDTIEERSVADPKREGRLLTPWVILDPLAGVRFQDVMRTEAAMTDSLPDGAPIQFRIGKWHRFGWIVPVGTGVPARLERTLIVPKQRWNAPDDEPKGRPELDILQDGRVLAGKTTVYSPARDKKDFSRLLGHLRELRARAKDQGLVEKVKLGGFGRFKGFTGQGVTVPILIHADMWTEWSVLERVLELCVRPDVMFWKRELAVHEYDMEQRLLEKRRK